MNVIKGVAAAVAACVAIAGAPQALAQGMQGKAYVGFSAGSTDIDSGVAFGLISSGTVDGKDSGYKIFGGYRFHPNFAGEIAYVDLGRVTYSGTYGGATVTNGSIDITGLNFSIVGLLPLGSSVNAFGKLGFLAWEADARDLTNGIPFAQTITGSDISFGVGLSFEFTKTIGARIEWDSYKINSDTANMYSAGVVFSF